MVINSLGFLFASNILKWILEKPTMSEMSEMPEMSAYKDF